MISLTAEDLLDTIIDSCTTFGSNNVYIPSTLIIVLTPDHAKLLDRDGWDKQRIREHIHARAHNEVTFINNRGIIPVRPESFKNRQLMPVTRSPSDIEIVVAGGRGGHSSVILPWGLYSEAIIEPVLLPNGNVANTIYDFKQA